jgi:NAD(P)-dependent dehydrogenase (short-subunit alcohol dehydrogenase family)/alkylhydroperoxidase/carboxymuconolactone decarboxylase family protein YurZ
MPQVFFLTGSSRGLGREIAEAALAAGHYLVATARDPASVASLAERYGDRVLPVQLDVTDPAAAVAAVNAGTAAFGRIDVVVNNAGYANLAAVEDISLDDFREQVDANLFGVVNVTKAALPVLRAQGGGHVIQVSSIGGRLATPGLSAYQAAKWAVGGFSEVLAREVGPLGIKVTVLEPGGMRTDWAGSSMRVPPVSGPYQPTVGASAAMHSSDDFLGDPAKVAKVVLAVAEMAEPPLRLILGSEAYAYATAAARARAESDAAWHDLTVSTDRDDATPAQRDPLAAARERQDDYQRALETAGRLLGKPLVLPLGDGEPAVGEDFRRLATVATFGQSWPREGLDDRGRALISVAIAATLGTHEPLRGQLRIALRAGVTKEEVVELFIHLAAYAGAARAFDSYQDALTVFAEAG